MMPMTNIHAEASNKIVSRRLPLIFTVTFL